MTAGDTLRSAYDALRANPLRSGLTMLGVIIGIAAVVILMTVGRAAQRGIDLQIASLGTHVLLILPNPQAAQGGRGDARGQRLTEATARALRREVPAVVAAAPTISQGVTAVHGSRSWPTTLQGVDAQYLVARDWAMAEGGSLSEWDTRSGAKVAVLGATVARRLFGDDNPLGQRLRIDNQLVEVVGVLAGKGHGVGTRDQNDLVLVPLRTAQARFAGHYRSFAGGVDLIVVRFDERVPLASVMADIAAVLAPSRGPTAGERPFRVLPMTDALQVQAAATERLSRLLAAIASVSLLVGGIGIMNMMLVSVTERTREIGIRRAVGASGADIRRQFLSEAALLSTLGGLLGAVVAVAVSGVLLRIMALPAVWDVRTLVIAVAASAAIGLFFGYFPARRAARRPPAEALRHE